VSSRFALRSTARIVMGALVMVTLLWLNTTVVAAAATVERLAAVRIGRPGVVLIRGQNVPDPFMTRVGGRYYLFSSQEAFYGPHIPVRVSRSLTHWGRAAVDALPELPSWAANGYTWSPDVRFVDGRWVMWFNALLRGVDPPLQTKCIGVAVARHVTGPYHPVGRRPAICQLADWGSIDPRTMLGPNGGLWLLWKSDNNANPSGRFDTKIFIQRLAADGIHLVGKPTELISANQPWDSGIVEAPDMVHAAGHYWLFYSAGWFNQPTYAIGVDRCASPLGPCRPARDGPWFGSNRQGAGPGEASIFDDGTRWWMLYTVRAANPVTGGGVRPTAIARLEFSPRGPTVIPPGSPRWAAPQSGPQLPGIAGANGATVPVPKGPVDGSPVPLPGRSSPRVRPGAEGAPPGVPRHR